MAVHADLSRVLRKRTGSGATPSGFVTDWVSRAAASGEAIRDTIGLLIDVSLVPKSDGLPERGVAALIRSPPGELGNPGVEQRLRTVDLIGGDLQNYPVLDLLPGSDNAIKTIRATNDAEVR